MYMNMYFINRKHLTVSIAILILQFNRTKKEFSLLLQSPNNVVEYTLSGNTAALNYFRVDSRSGQISLIRPVSADTSNPSSYQVPITFGRLYQIRLMYL